jgi:uncharacterized protein YecE (DUF72 family)
MKSSQTIQLPYYLGCPVWSCAHWAGTVYSQSAKRTQWLRDYSQVFNTVEGNSTFYALPKLDVAQRWGDEAASGFRFAFKFPQTISHVPQLRYDARDLQSFIDFLDVLATRNVLGDTFLQLPPQCSYRDFGALQELLQRLPKEWTFAVEPRHADWFDQAQCEQEFDALLREHGMSRVLFDSRPLYSLPASDEAERVSQTRKPKSPHRTTVTNQRPMLRLVGRNRIEEVDSYLDQWSDTIADWLRNGLVPYIFTHTPDDQFAPQMAQLLHEKLRQRIPALPKLTWQSAQPRGAQQLDLF